MKARALAINYTHCYKLVAFIRFECVQIEPLVYNGRGYAVVLMPYSLCCTLCGDLVNNLNK